VIKGGATFGKKWNKTKKYSKVFQLKKYFIFPPKILVMALILTKIEA